MLHNKTFNIAKNPKYDGYQTTLTSMVYKFSDEISASPADKSAAGGDVENRNMSNQHFLDLAKQELTEELHKLIVS